MEQKETVTTNTSHGEYYNEAFDVKLLRTRNVLNPRCEKCHNWGHHHRPECEYATRGDALHHMDEARKWSKHAKDRAADWMQACRQMHGKIAMLKHENNKLRKKVVPQPDRAMVKKLHWVEGPARGGSGTAGKDRWRDGDMLLVVVEMATVPSEIFLVHVNADGDQLSMITPYTGNDDFGFMPGDVSWWAKVEPALPTADD